MNVLQLIINLVEILVFVYLGVAAIYIFIFGFSSLFARSAKREPIVSQKRVAVLIPGYKEDDVIIEVAREALNQTYKQELYDVVVIADSFHPDTVSKLKELPIIVVEVSFEKSTKSKSLNAAMAHIGDNYDLAVVLDADNIMNADFLELVVPAFNESLMAAQGHRIAKNLNTSMAVLDALSEEINNNLFRKGHRVLGLSSGLVGSGMIFDYPFFKSLMSKIQAVGGFDKELELRILKQRLRIEYIHEAKVLDEKVQKKEVFAKQRRRWLSAQLVYFRRYLLDGISGLIRQGNIDFFDKVFQMGQPPRVLLAGFLTFILFVVGVVSLISANWVREVMMFGFLEWLIIWSLTLLALMCATPRSFYSRKTLVALIKLPGSFLIMFSNLFRLKGANKTFIHTDHGVENKPNENSN